MATETREASKPPLHNTDEGKKSEKSKKEKATKKDSVTPTSDRPTRERKTIERFSAPSPLKLGRFSASKGLVIEEGRGTQLKDIPNVAFKLSKRKPDENLHMLHSILFGKTTKAHNLKKNIGQFSGYVWAENEEKQRTRVNERIYKCMKEKLVDFCDVLDIPIKKSRATKEELAVKLLKFLESPHVTTDVLLAEKEQKQKQSSQSGKKRKHSSDVEEGDKAELSDRKEVSHEDEVSQGEGMSSKKAKVEPSKEEMRAGVVDILKKLVSHFTTTSEILEKLGTHFGLDLMHRKEEVMAIITNVIHNLPREEDEGEVGESASPSKSKQQDTRGKVASKTSKTPEDQGTHFGLDLMHRKEEVMAIITNVIHNLPREEDEGEVGESASPSKSKQQDTRGKVASKTSKTPEDQGKGISSKKVNVEPSKEDMIPVVVDILKVVTRGIRMSDIIEKLGTHFGLDLMHRKEEVKAIITHVLFHNRSNSYNDGEVGETDDDGGDDDQT